MHAFRIRGQCRWGSWRATYVFNAKVCKVKSELLAPLKIWLAAGQILILLFAT
jgi:hypothetical protein